MKILITESQYSKILNLFENDDDLFGDYLFGGDVPRSYGYYAPEYEEDTYIEEELFLFLLNHYRQNSYEMSEYLDSDIDRFIGYFKYLKNIENFSDVVNTNLNPDDYIFRGSRKKMDKGFFVGSPKVFIYNDSYYFVHDTFEHTHKNAIQSWTLDFEVAKNFAEGWACPMPMIYVSKAKHGDLYFNEDFARIISDREEREVINIKKTMIVVPIVVLSKFKIRDYLKMKIFDIEWFDSLPKTNIENIDDMISTFNI